MPIGVALPNRGAIATPENLESLALAAERFGYDSIWVGDHLAIPLHWESEYPYAAPGRALDASQPYTESLTTLAYLAGATQRIRIGTRVLVLPLRHPVVTAKALATLDWLSRGRLLVGVGVGWLQEEFETLDAPDFSRRGQVTDEYLQLFRELWTNPTPSFEGTHARFAGATILPLPHQPGGPPIWIGGHSAAALRRAARFGDGWFPIGLAGAAGLGPDELGERVRQLRRLTTAAGRPAETVTVSFSATVRFDTVAGGEGAVLSGDDARIAADLYRYQDAGADHFVAGFPGGHLAAFLEDMERFAHDVVPRLTATTA